ncbi:hypothetical protein V1511DRAFT_508606 [Dipodascopsis uninucleata]
MVSRQQDKSTFERNQQILKSLLKQPGNKYCSDCKKNAYPRWASWNLGIFICIRCSGIHRSMGTHISRVKSVDLDSWTDEQLQSMVRWGNTKANKYWEAGLQVGHQPPDNKIENFIRTKYEMKRWCAPGPIPDPDTISDTERDESSVLPNESKLSSVTSKTASLVTRNPAYTSSPSAISSETYHKNKVPDLLGSVTARPASTPISSSRGTATNSNVIGSTTIRLKTDTTRQSPVVPKPSDDLLSLGAPPVAAPIPRASSAGSNSIPSAVSATASMRPDLKSSILSLYATPKLQNPILGNAATFQSVTGNGVSMSTDPSILSSSSSSQNNSFSAELINPFSDLSIKPASSSTSATLSPTSTQSLNTSTTASIEDPFATLGDSNAWSSTSRRPTVVAQSTTSSTTSVSTGLSFESDLWSATAATTTNLQTSRAEIAPLEDEFGGFATAPSSGAPFNIAGLSSAGFEWNSPAADISGFGETVSATAVPAGFSNSSMATTPTADRKKEADEMFSNVWG